MCVCVRVRGRGGAVVGWGRDEDERRDVLTRKDTRA